MQTLLRSETPGPTVPLWLVTEATYGALLQSLPAPQAAWARAQGFAAERQRLLLLPAADGGIAGALWGLGALPGLEELSVWDAAALPERLPAGNYQVATRTRGVGGHAVCPRLAARQLSLEPLPGQRAQAGDCQCAGRSAGRRRALRAGHGAGDRHSRAT